MNSILRARRTVFAATAAPVMAAAVTAAPTVGAVVIAAAVLWASPVGAEGAMAVGIARGGVAKGYATGFALNQASDKVARSSAVEGCRKDKNSNADARSNCEVVVTFRNKCIASAVDPKSGTPGAGWGTGTTQKAADSQALARCKATAGSDRADSCQITDRFCDGTAR
jgi:hypothetical protein